MEMEALFKNSRICLLIVCSYWLSHYWRRALISGCAVCCESERWRGQGYNTEHLSLLFSGSLRSTLPLDTGIKVSRQLWGHFLIDAQQPLWDETCCISLTFGNSLKRLLARVWGCNILHGECTVVCLMFVSDCRLKSLSGSDCFPRMYPTEMQAWVYML